MYIPSCFVIPKLDLSMLYCIIKIITVFFHSSVLVGKFLVTNLLIGLFQTIEMGLCDTDADILKLKAAIWALGHFGSSTKGAELLNSRGAIAATVSLAQTSAVFAVRATAYYSLGLLATTRTGADCLFKLGWVCTRHDRHDRWPIIEEENWEEGKMEDGLHGLQIGSDSERTSSDQPFVGDFGFMIAEDSATDDELIYIESGSTFIFYF